MATAPEVPTPERKQGYAYGLDGFTANKIRREDPDRLKYLLLPQLIKDKRAQQAAQKDADSVVKKPWIIAQLKHYGYGISAAITVNEAKALLGKGVSEGHCDTVPHWVLAIEASLRKLFEPRKRDYDLKLSGNFVSEAERVAREFSALATPSAEAAYSIDLFMRKYFIDDTGKPDKTKRPDPLPLPGFPNRARIHAATEHVPGLVSVSGGRDNDRTVVIGWDDGLVESVAREIGSHQSAKKKVADEAEWDSLMQKHRKLVRSSEKAVPGKRFSIESARGRYIIKCDSASSYSLDDSNKLRLRITEGSEGWVGIMDFGILEGIMLLGEDREDVASRAQQSRDDTSYDSEDSEPADYEQSSEEECETPVRATKKRPAVSLRRGPPSKRPKRSRSGGDVLYFQWRGEETGEGEVQLDPSNKHVGHLNFLDASGMKFNGMASFGFLGDKVRFQGFKIGGLGGPASRSWYDYSEAAYEQARVGRWH